MRFTAPERADLDAAVFLHPVFETLFPGHLALCRQPDWPDVADLNTLWHAPENRFGKPYRFAAQEVLADGLHYEQRIFDQGLIATRSRNWHDLFNAMVWLRDPYIKMALNRRQVEDIRRVGTRERTRGQCALTHFDEAGAVLRLADAAMLSAWDAHDWPAFFAVWEEASKAGRVQLHLFGHSIQEHALNPDIALVAKALVIDAPVPLEAPEMDAAVAQAIEAKRCLNDPQELRPIPLSGIPGWHPGYGSVDFFERMPCFRPKRAGKTYPPPLQLA